MIRKIFIIIIAALLSDTLVSQEISKIKIIYGCEGTLLPVSASCTPESFNFSFGDDLNFLITYDRTFFDKFSNLHKKIYPSNVDDSIQTIDPRIMSIIVYEDSIPNDTICFGEFYGICQNGVLMKNNESLLALVKKKIGWNSEIDKNSKLRLNKRRDNNENMK